MDVDGVDSSTFQRGQPSRKLVAIIIAVLMFGALLATLLVPICEPIPLDILPRFETQRTLEERAAAGEPFARRNGRWCVCRSGLARAFRF